MALLRCRTREMVNMSTTGCATLLETSAVIDEIKDADVSLNH